MRRVIVTLLICVFALGMNAQDMTSVFTQCQTNTFLNWSTLGERIWWIFILSGKESRLKNTMNGFSALKNLTSDYLLLQVTDRSTIEMKLLPLVNNTNVICMVKTVNGPVPDSRIEFFTTEMGTFGCFRPCSLLSRRIGLSKKMQIKTVRLFWMLLPVWIWI